MDNVNKVDWWTSPKQEAHNDITNFVARLDQTQAARRDKNIRSMMLYGNTQMSGFGPNSYVNNTAFQLPENRVKLNIVSSMCDTVSAKISKMKPRATFLTSGGDFTAQERAKKLSKFIIGAFYQNKVYELHQKGFRDSTILDVGAVKHFIQDGKICSEWVLAPELYVDDADALYGKPSHMYQVKYVPKNVLEKQFKKHAAAIKMSSPAFDVRQYLGNMESDFVCVIEAWHLPSTPTANDGRHVICTDQVTLVDEKYTKDYFPFTFFKWSPPVVGFVGQSLAERLTGNQIEINKMLRIIQRSFHLGSAFKVFLEYGSKVAKEHINNDIGSIVYYAGAKPDFYTPQTVHPEYFQHLRWLIQSSYEEAGVSQLSATSKVPAGIDGGSGKALREYNDLETERFVLVAQAYEATFLETARQYIDLAVEMYENGIDMEVVAESKRFIESIKWSDINLDKNQYIMQCFPTSSLPNDPAGRLAYVQELVNSGYIDKDYALSLLDFPDVEAYAALKTAPLDDIMDTLDHLLYQNKFVSPEPFQNLALGIQIMQAAYLKAKKDNAPDDRLDNVRRWIAAAQAMVQQAQQAAAMQAPPQQLPPQQVPPAV